MRKSKKAKEDKLKFEANIITVKKLISLYVNKTIPIILTLKLSEIKECLNDIEELNHLSELIALDIPNNEEIFKVLSSIWSIDNNEIIHNEEAMEQFPILLLELISKEYVNDILENYNKKDFKVNSYLNAQEVIADNVGEEEYGLFIES